MTILSWLRKRKVAVLMGGSSAEREISFKTGRAMLASLLRQGIRAVGLDAQQDLPYQLKRQQIQAVYIALHGPMGEDGVVQGLLEWMKIPYTGSGVLASALAMDKIACKRVFDAAQLPTAKWTSLRKSDCGMRNAECGIEVITNRKNLKSEIRNPKSEIARHLGFPLVVKPSCQGSAIGVSIVRQASQLPKALLLAWRYGNSILLEQFIEGPEITVGILGTQALPVIEIVPAQREFYDFHAKYAPGGSTHVLPARISKAQAQKAQTIALQVCDALGTQAVARVDFIVDRRKGPMLLEVNTIPGMTETSLLPEAARAIGIDFDQLVLKIGEYSFNTQGLVYG